MSEQTYDLRLFGQFYFQSPDGARLDIRGEKQMALIAILVLAPNGRQGRGWLQEMLWGRSGADLGRASLRRALSDLRRHLGDHFDVIFQTEGADVAIDQERINILGDPSDGDLLAGFAIKEPGFLRWLEERRGQADDRRLRLPSLIGHHLNPVICVVPFAPVLNTSMSSQLGDLIALELTRALTKCAHIDVISHLSSRRFQVSNLSLSTVRRELNADYLVYGTVRSIGQCVKLCADLVELQTEKILWSEEIDLDVAQLTAADWVEMADIAGAIFHSVAARSVELTQHEGAGHGLQIHHRLMAAISMMHQHRRDIVGRAHTELRHLVNEFPSYAKLHAWLAKLYVLNAHQGWASHTEDDQARAVFHCTQALEIDPTCSFSRAIHGLVLSNLRHDFDAGADALERALESNRSNALAWLLKGAMLAFWDRGPEAVLCTSKARNLSPLDPHRYYFDCLSATAHLASRDFETAARLSARSYEANPRHASTLRVRTIALQEMGATSEAADCARELMALDPGFTVSAYTQFHPAAKFSTGESWARALSKAGVPV